MADQSTFLLISEEQARKALDRIKEIFNRMLLNRNIKGFDNNDTIGPFSSTEQAVHFKYKCKLLFPYNEIIDDECKVLFCNLAYEIRTLETYIYQLTHPNDDFYIDYRADDIINLQSTIPDNYLDKCLKKAKVSNPTQTSKASSLRTKTE